MWIQIASSADFLNYHLLYRNRTQTTRGTIRLRGRHRQLLRPFRAPNQQGRVPLFPLTVTLALSPPTNQWVECSEICYLGSCSPLGFHSPLLGRGTDGVGAGESRGGGGDSCMVRPAIAQHRPHVFIRPGSSWLEIYTSRLSSDILCHGYVIKTEGSTEIGLAMMMAISPILLVFFLFFFSFAELNGFRLSGVVLEGCTSQMLWQLMKNE